MHVCRENVDYFGQSLKKYRSVLASFYFKTFDTDISMMYFACGVFEKI